MVILPTHQLGFCLSIKVKGDVFDLQKKGILQGGGIPSKTSTAPRRIRSKRSYIIIGVSFRI
jgi:hypothetical protein